MRLSRCVLISSACLLLIQASRGVPRLRHAHGDPRCSKCPPGSGVSRACTAPPLRDTQCRRCPPGAFSPHHSSRAPCLPCSRCGGGLYEAHPCLPASDTVCDACRRPRTPPRGNADYARRCGRLS